MKKFLVKSSSFVLDVRCEMMQRERKTLRGAAHSKGLWLTLLEDAFAVHGEIEKEIFPLVNKFPLMLFRMYSKSLSEATKRFNARIERLNEEKKSFSCR